MPELNLDVAQPKFSVLWPAEPSEGWRNFRNVVAEVCEERGIAFADWDPSEDPATLDKMRVIVPGTKDWVNRDAIIARVHAYGWPVALLKDTH